MTERKNTPKGALRISHYDELRQFVEAFANGQLNLLILIGPAGVAKSQTVRRAVGDSACWIEGNATAFGMYRQLYKHRGDLVVIDDVDALYSDRQAVRLLKCLCQTDPVKQIAWHTAATTEDISSRFETTSHVCIIANDWKTLNANTSAVQDRGHLVMFEPMAAEVHRQVAQWFDDQEVFDWFGRHLDAFTEPSMRNYVKAAELKRIGVDWVRAMLTDVVDPRALAIARLRADSRYRFEHERIKAFSAQGYGSRTTYYKIADMLGSASQPTEPITLKRFSGTSELKKTA